ncbi:MAG: PIN domain-containing protein [Nanoarchaeota archaeon]
MESLPNSLILDANILFSFFKSDSTRRHLIRELVKQEVQFFSPDFTFEEILSDKDKIKKFANIDENEFTFLLRLLTKQITSIHKEKYASLLSNAKSLSPHEKDIHYFALALFLKIPIWSDENAFKNQESIEIITTKKLLELI